MEDRSDWTCYVWQTPSYGDFTCSSRLRDFQSSIARRMASGARLLHLILYSGIPPRASATACSEMRQASSTGRPRTISVAMDEQAMATAHPMHLNLAS